LATLAELEARLEALKAQRDSAVARVSYDGRSVECRGTAEVARAIADLERELQAAQGTAPERQIWIFTSKRSLSLKLISRIAGAARLLATGKLAQSTGFEGAQMQRRLMSWRAGSESINSLVLQGRELQRARARQLVRTRDIAAGMLTWSTNTMLELPLFGALSAVWQDATFTRWDADRDQQFGDDKCERDDAGSIRQRYSMRRPRASS
jgi:hypothetical protein